MSGRRFDLDPSERADRIGAVVTRFQSGDIGPVTFALLLANFGMPADEIRFLRDTHAPENRARSCGSCG